MAEGILKKILEDYGEKTKGIQVISAGTAAIEGQCAAKNAIQAMHEKGIDISNHEARIVTKELIDKADLILTMTKNHKAQLLNIIVDEGKKIYTLKEYIGAFGDILDPFGQSTGIYRQCANEIEEILKVLVEKII